MNSSRHRKFLLGPTIAVSSLLNYGRNAYAGCAPTVFPTYLCTGSVTEGQTVGGSGHFVVTDPDFSVNVGAGNLIPTGLEIHGFADITFTDIHPEGDRSYFATDNDSPALHVRNPQTNIWGDMNVTTNGTFLGGSDGIKITNRHPGAVHITTGEGSITGKKNAGINANIAWSQDFSINTGDGDIFGGTFGIDARNNSAHFFSITTGRGNITGASDTGIAAFTTQGTKEMKITTGEGDILGGKFGLFASNSGVGALIVTTGDGSITGTSDLGLRAFGDVNSTSLDVTAGSGNIKGGKYAIAAFHSGKEAMSIVSGMASLTGGIDGILVQNASLSSATVQTGSGAVLGTTRYGINAQGNVVSAALTVLSGDGAVTGGTVGIYGQTYGSGPWKSAPAAAQFLAVTAALQHSTMAQAHFPSKRVMVT